MNLLTWIGIIGFAVGLVGGGAALVIHLFVLPKYRRASSTKIQLARDFLAERLSRDGGRWEVAGDAVIGEGNTAIVVADQDEAGTTHIDLGFMIHADRSDAPVIWDCVAGAGDTMESGLKRAVDIWTISTAPAIFELLSQDGRHADHYLGSDHEGFAGWHTIQGPIVGWGTSEASTNLQRWAVDNTLLPVVEPIVRELLDDSGLNWIKLMFGSVDGESFSEVRVNGVPIEEAAGALDACSWPRSEQEFAVVRLFALLVHLDEEVVRCG